MTAENRWVDLDIAYRGPGMAIIHPNTTEGEDWIETNVDYENWQIVGQDIVIEGSLRAFDIAVAATADGLIVDYAGIRVPTRMEAMQRAEGVAK
jgi:hypothetical protein